MKKIITTVLLTITFVACSEKKIQLPKANTTIVSTVQDLSTIAIFFTTNGKDTLADVKKNTIISTTNWIFNIDKRLPLKSIMPDIIMLQEKKIKKFSTQNKDKENYFSYADSLQKKLAFFPFTKISYHLQKQNELNSKNALILQFKNNQSVYCNGVAIPSNQLKSFMQKNYGQQKTNVFLIFDKNCTFNQYLQYKIALTQLKMGNLVFSTHEYIL